MKKNQKYHKHKNTSRGMAIMIGAGLILFGIALFILLQGADNASASIPADRSVVPMAVNYSAPPLTLENLNGATESLEDFRGKVLLVNNWATWCPPCKAEMPTLEKYFETYESRGFSIIAIDAGDDRESVSQFVQDFGLKFNIWLDPDGAALEAFRNGGLPNSYVINRAGTVRYAWTGEISFAMLEKFVTPIIMEKY